MSALPKWTTACPDWRERIRKNKSLVPCKPLFPDQAAQGLSIFGDLRMVDAANQPMSALSRQWTNEFVASIFGSYEEEAGRRHISEYFLLISKKNGKSTYAAGIMLTALILNWRESAEYIILSPTVEIANNSFKPAADMVRADDELSSLFIVQDHIRTITHRVTGATLKVIAADSEAVGGKKATGVLIDELWLFGKRAGAADMFREAIGGLASRPEGFVIYLTTQSNEPPAGVFKEKLEYARSVRDGIIDDPQFLPVLYEFPEDMLEPVSKEYLDSKNFYMTNPNLGASVDELFLLREYKKAQQVSEEEVRGFLAKHLNVEIGMNLRSDAWPGAFYWQPAEVEAAISLQTLIDECEVIAVGIDGGGLDDLLGASFIGRRKKFENILVPEHVDEVTGKTVPATTISRQKWLSFSYAWAHPSVLTRRLEIAPRLKDFANAGEMTLVAFMGQDVDELAEMVGQVEESGLLYKIGLDPNCIGGVLDALLQVGVPEDKMVSVNQGYRLAGAIKTFERKLSEGVLIHGKNSMMNWCVGNAKVKVVGNAIVITKQVSGTAKIDPLMAGFNAASLMALNPPAQSGDYDFSSMVIGG